MLKTRSSYGRRYHYEPNGILLRRIARQTGMTITEVRDQILKERKALTA